MPQNEFDISGREFGKAPCPRQHEINGCPGNDCCEEGALCLEILEHEWPLAQLAITMSKNHA